MDVREKLVEWLAEVLPYSHGCPEYLVRAKSEMIADHLIARGVTVQSGIDANTFRLMRECERLKEEKESLANAVNVLEEINSDLYKKLKGVTVQEWISVKDRLPSDEKPVLAYYGFMHKENGGTALRYTGTLSYFCFDHQPHWQHESTGLIVTHWMPLPKPPKGE